MKKATNSGRTTDLTAKAARVVDRVKKVTNIPKKYLIEEAIVEYLPQKYEKQTA